MAATPTPRIDAHQHFWRYDEAEYAWITEPLEALRRDFLPADLAPLLSAAELDGSIAVQARQSLAETDFLLGLDPEGQSVRGVVGWLDLAADDLEAQLERYSDASRLVGVRHVVQDEPDDRFLDRESFRAGVRRAAAAGLVYDVLIYPRQLPAALDFVRALDEVPMVLDHCAKPPLAAGGAALDDWEAGFRQLARCPNLSCKVSGLVTEADWASWRDADLDRCAEIALEAFGPARLLAGSDWPVCTLAASYDRVQAVAERLAESLSPDERAAFLGGNAARVYRLED